MDWERGYTSLWAFLGAIRFLVLGFVPQPELPLIHKANENQGL
ncbi:MAG: hypothetical protein V7L29_00535 [Nostoc sp.]